MARTRLRGLQLAGTRIAIEVPSHLEWRWPNDAVERFACTPESPDVYVAVRTGSLPGMPVNPIVYQSGSHTFEVGRRGEDWIVAVHGRERFERVAVFDDDFGQGEVTLSAAAAVARTAPLAHPLDEILALHRVVRAGGLVVRGSAVPREQRALVFLGSGQPATEEGGWRCGGSSQLAGDRLVLMPTEDGVRVLGTPWHSDRTLSRPFTAGVDALHVIQPARAVFADRLDPDDAIDAVLAHAFAPVHDIGCAERLFDSAGRVARRAPVLRLGLPEEKRVVPFTWGQSEAALAFAPPFVN